MAARSPVRWSPTRTQATARTATPIQRSPHPSSPASCNEAAMLDDTKQTYALGMWTVQKRPNGWYFSKSTYHGDKHEWRGPYASEFSVTLMIARELQKEIRKPPAL